jgi:hypothetical protein
MALDLTPAGSRAIKVSTMITQEKFEDLKEAYAEGYEEGVLVGIIRA